MQSKGPNLRLGPRDSIGGEVRCISSRSAVRGFRSLRCVSYSLVSLNRLGIAADSGFFEKNHAVAASRAVSVVFLDSVGLAR